MADRGQNTDLCALQKAGPMQCVGYRGVKKPPADGKDLLNFVQLKQVTIDKASCQHYGISIWIREGDALHAQRTFGYMKKWYIATMSIQEDDGYIANTPRDGDEEHHTFWLRENCKVLGSLKVAFPPIKR